MRKISRQGFEDEQRSLHFVQDEMKNLNLPEQSGRFFL